MGGRGRAHLPPQGRRSARAAALHRIRKDRPGPLSQQRRRRPVHRPMSVTRTRQEVSGFSVAIVCYRSRGGRMMHARIAGVAVGVLLLSAAAALAVTKLSPKEIQETVFNGEPCTASTPSNIKFKMVLTTDGTMTREPGGGAVAGKREGPW